MKKLAGALKKKIDRQTDRQTGSLPLLSPFLLTLSLIILIKKKKDSPHSLEKNKC
jgi:hypothetical protein